MALKWFAQFAACNSGPSCRAEDRVLRVHKIDWLDNSTTLSVRMFLSSTTPYTDPALSSSYAYLSSTKRREARTRRQDDYLHRRILLSRPRPSLEPGLPCIPPSAAILNDFGELLPHGR